MIHDKAKVVAHLRGLADGSVEPQIKRESGICLELSIMFCGSWVPIVVDLSRDWKEYSGNPKFPVHTDKKRHPKGQLYSGTSSWTGEYGASRRRLCAHLADKIEAMEGELEV